MLPLIPRPVVAEENGETFTLTADTTITAPAGLDAVIGLFRATLRRDHGLDLVVDHAAVEAADERLPDTGSGADDHGRGPAAGVVVALTDSDAELAGLPATAGVRADDLGADAERYRLQVDGGGVRLTATHPAGVHRGLVTLRQLMIDGPTVPGVRILDAPRYSWRGLSLDVVRTFFSPDEVRRVIDLLDAYKLNVLHLHLTDDQGWRLQIDGRPELTEIGATGAYGDRTGGFYTQQEYAALVAYAAERFITVVPEFDLPGHSSALLKAYPEFGKPAPGGQDLEQPITQLNDEDPELWRLVSDVLAQYAALTPGRFIHLGGDEAFGLSDEFHRSFLDRAVGIVHDLGKRVVGWQEAARAGLAEGDIAQYWIDFADRIDEMFSDERIPAPVARLLKETFRQAPGDVGLAAGRGADILFSPVSFCYLDRPYAERSTDPGQHEQQDRLGLAAYGAVTIEQAFDFDPDSVLAGVTGDATVAGVEAAIWCESITDESDLHTLLLPRLVGIAERAWSPAGSSWDDYRPRLAAQPPLWQRLGLSWFRAPALLTDEV